MSLQPNCCRQLSLNILSISPKFVYSRQISSTESSDITIMVMELKFAQREANDRRSCRQISSSENFWFGGGGSGRLAIATDDRPNFSNNHHHQQQHQEHQQPRVSLRCCLALRIEEETNKLHSTSNYAHWDWCFRIKFHFINPIFTNQILFINLLPNQTLLLSFSPMTQLLIDDVQ